MCMKIAKQAAVMACRGITKYMCIWWTLSGKFTKKFVLFHWNVYNTLWKSLEL